MFHGHWAHGHHGRRGQMFERGAIKYLILDLISKKPRHGYDIIRDIEESCGGCYSPSAGTVYPTLQMLEDLGYVLVREENGKKVYEVTKEGQEFLAKHKEKIEHHHERMAECCQGAKGREGTSSVYEIRSLLNFIRSSIRHNLGDAEKVEAIKAVLVKAKKDIEGIASA